MRSLRPGWRPSIACSAIAAAGCAIIAPIGDPLPINGPSGTGGANTPIEGDGGREASVEGARCVSNSDCMPDAAIEPHFCRSSDHRCVALKSAECPLVYGDVSDPNAIFFGAFASLNPALPEASPIVNVYRLALDELSGDSHGGLPRGPGGALRPLVMTVCSADGDDSAVDAAVTHLVEDVEVPAILAYLKPGDLNRAFTRHRTGQIFFLSPVGADTALAALPDQGLVWHMLGQPSDLTPAYVELLRLAEQYVRDSRGLASRPVRVALVTTVEAFDSELANFVVPALTFNGKSQIANAEDGNYQGYTIDAEHSPADVGLDIYAFQPDIVVSTAGEPFTQPGGVVPTIEMYWGQSRPDGGPPGPRPFYMLSPINYGGASAITRLIEGQMSDFGIDPLAYRRFVGISAAEAVDLTLKNGFATRLRMRFPGTDPETENFYDAFYFLAYSMFGAGSVASLTGPGIAGGMLRLINGTHSYDVGPTEISDVESALAVPNATIRLNGTMGPPDFNPATGVRVDVGSVFCFQQLGNDVVPKAQVLRYDPAAMKFSGDFPCFAGFVR